jgi:hypothetical protein
VELLAVIRDYRQKSGNPGLPFPVPRRGNLKSPRQSTTLAELPIGDLEIGHSRNALFLAAPTTAETTGTLRMPVYGRFTG